MTFVIPIVSHLKDVTNYSVPGSMLCFGVRKEMFLLVFNDALNTFYLWLYCVGHMVKDHSHSEIGNLLPPHGLLFFGV